MVWFWSSLEKWNVTINSIKTVKKRYVFLLYLFTYFLSISKKHLNILPLFKYHTIKLFLRYATRTSDREVGCKKILHLCFFFDHGKHRRDLSLKIITFLAKLVKSAFCYFCYNLNSLLLGCQKTYLWFDGHFLKDNFYLQKCRKM